ncbi:DUF5723 family protein [Hymenobacter saemangeumensis]|uniref:DUF5723 family protein n=1 Tax=Hymenobacter saemangeumensis TaxID=1084522 RepID=A0ABP8IFP2_9BACT
MKPVRVFLTALLLLGLARPAARAQGWVGLANSNYAGTNGLFQNPSAIADSHQKFYISLGGADFNFYNTYLQLDMPYTPWQVVRNKVDNQYRDEYGNILFKRDYLKETVNGKTKFATASAEVRLPAFMVSIGPGYAVALSSRVRGFVQAVNVSEPVARLARYSLDEAERLGLAKQVLTDNGFNVSANAFQEINLTVAHTFSPNVEHFFKGGLTAKYLVGMGSAYVNNEGASYQVYGADSIQVRDRRVTYGSTDYRYYQRNDFKVGDFFGSNRLGRGFGADVGITYEWRPTAEKYEYKMDGETWTDHTVDKYRLKVGVALVDLGAIEYNNADYVRQARLGNSGTVQWGSLDTLKYRSLAEVDNLMQKVLNINSKSKKFTTVLPAALHLNADYRFSQPFFRNKFFLGAAWTQNLLMDKTVGSRAISSVALIPRLEFKQAELTFPVMLANNYQQLQLGAMVRLGPLAVGSDNLGGVFGATTISGYDVYASLGWGLGKTKPHKDDDKDGVSNALDKCPKVKGVWEFQGCPDRDGDHVPDATDVCPDTPGLAKFKGCPDTDKDGTQDSEDECPTEPGPAKFKGCPDGDGDGTPDKYDQCPEDRGPVETKGCPDRDSDGVMDQNDKCPDTPGPADHFGCPDTDADTLYDNEDECPTVAGPVENKGCPYADSDNDGVLDNVDACPRTPGPASNKGCPVLKKAEIKIIQTAFANLEFETGKDIIRKKSYPSLNALAKLIVGRPTYILQLAGHTDNVGKPAANLLLSQKRTEAVKRYLVSKGVPDSHITTEWFGQTKPKASNKTAAGRARNRRVDMKVTFE